MVKLVYVSRAREPMSDDALTELLEVARSRNQAENVTGMLVYANQSFVQILEGAATSVDTIYRSVETDPRHTDIRRLARETIAQRRFANWWMGFELMDASSLAAWMPGYRWPRNVPLADTGIITDTDVAESLLKRCASSG